MNKEVETKIEINQIRGYELKENPGDYVSAEEVKQLLDACENTRNANRNWVIIYLLGITGKRINEILHLRVNDINLEENMIRFNILKRRRNYTKWKPYPKELVQRVGLWVELEGLKDMEYIFQGGTSKQACFKRIRTRLKVNGRIKYVSTVNCRGNHLSDRAVDMMVKNISKKAGLEKIRGITPHCHMFRKGVVTRMVKKMSKEGESLDKIIKAADYMDWKDINYIIRIYYMYNPKSKREFAELVSEDILL